MWILFVVLVGAVAGSMLTAVIDRVPASPASFFRSRSRCPACGHALAFKDLVPVFSFLFLRGRCRYCQQAIPRWHFAVELTTISLFLSVALLFPSAPLGEYVLLWVLLAGILSLAVIDLQVMLLPDALVFVLALAGLFRSVLFGHPPLEGALLGGLLGLALFWFLASLPRFVPRWRGGTTMGFGDVKLAGALGLALGPAGVIAGAFLAFVAGGVVGVGLLLTKRAQLKSHLPFGPFLAGAGALLLLFPELPARLFSLGGFR